MTVFFSFPFSPCGFLPVSSGSAFHHLKNGCFFSVKAEGMNQSMARNNEAEERTDAMFGEMDYLAHSVCHFMAGDGMEWSCWGGGLFLFGGLVF